MLRLSARTPPPANRGAFPVTYNIAVTTARWDPLQLAHYPFGTEVRGVGSLYRGFVSSDARLWAREIRGLLCEAEAVGRRGALLFGMAAIGIGPPEARARDLIVLMEGGQRLVVLARK